jgi:two-component system, NtrC family, sensor kinase
MAESSLPYSLRLLHEAALALHGAASLSELLELFVRHAARLTQASEAQLALHRGALAATLNGEVAPVITVPPQTWPVREGEWLLIGDFVSGAASDIPLSLHSRPLAALRVAAPQINAEFVTLLWEQAVVALEKARLFEQLETAKREWEAVFDGMADGIYICDEQDTILRANRAMETLISLPLRAVLGQKRRALMESLPEYLELQSEKRVEDALLEFDVREREFRCREPERIFVETGFTLRGDYTAPRRVYILRDVTEQRLLQEQFIQSEKLAALGEMLSGVAHELNNPLATVVGYAQLLETDDTLPAALKRQVNVVHHEAVRSSQIVQSLLAFSRRSVPEKARLDLNDVVRAVLEMRAFQLQNDSVSLRAECAENLPLIWGEMASLQQVLLNIVNNAIQAITQSGKGSEICIKTEAVSLAGQQLVRLNVRDDGPGIAPEYLRRIFDPFFTTKPAGQGTGLGMSLAHRTVTNHGGTIRAESRPGHGAIFIVDLPAAGAGNLPAQEAEEPLSAPHGHVLVIDDEEPIVLLITEILAGAGHRVTAAYNGAEALALLEHEEFDLIISDVRMPAVGGPTFFETLQTTRPDLLPSVVFVTGDTVSASTRAFLEKTGRPVLAKPFDPDRLLRLANENLRATARR